mgnify:CR=1 FL=1
MENNNTSLVLANLNDNVQTLAKIALINLPDNTPMAKAEKIVMKEIINFEMICMMKPELANLDKESIFIAVKQCIADNLTLSPNAGLVYLYPGKVCIGQNGSTKIYKDILVYEPTSEGRISIARQAGTLLDHKRPVVSFDDSGKVNGVTFEFLLNALPKPRWEIVKFDTNDFERWKQKSAAKYGGTPNANYTSFKGGIDPEFASAKAIKHGLKKRGTNANESRNSEFVGNVENVEVKETKDTVQDLTKRMETIKKEHAPDVVQDVKFEEVQTAQTEQTQLDLPNNNDLF